MNKPVQADVNFDAIENNASDKFQSQVNTKRLIDQTDSLARLETNFEYLKQNVDEIKIDLKQTNKDIGNLGSEIVSIKSFAKGAVWIGGILALIGLLPFFINQLVILFDK